MNKDQKAAAVEEIAAQIQGAEAVLAVDYRGISVPQVAELREKLNEAGARFRIVKNTLTERAAEKAGADELKELLEGPTAFTFVSEGGDIALAAKALNQFRREHAILEPKGGRMNGEPLSIEQILELARLPARDVLHAQLVGVVASPITGLVRGLNQLIAGFAQQLQQLVDQGLVAGEAGPADESADRSPQTAEETPEESPDPSPQSPEAQDDTAPPSEDDPAEAEQEAQAEEAEESPDPSPQSPETDEAQPPSEGDEEKEGE